MFYGLECSLTLHIYFFIEYKHKYGFFETISYGKKIYATKSYR